MISLLGRCIVLNREKLYDKLSTLVDFGSAVLAFGFIGIAALSFDLAFTFAIQVARLRH